MGGLMIAATTTATETEISPGLAVAVILGLVFWLFCGYKCAANQRWGMFVVGFFCGWLWLAGWLMGPKRSSYY